MPCEKPSTLHTALLLADRGGWRERKRRKRRIFITGHARVILPYISEQNIPIRKEKLEGPSPHCCPPGLSPADVQGHGLLAPGLTLHLNKTVRCALCLESFPQHYVPEMQPYRYTQWVFYCGVSFHDVGRLRMSLSILPLIALLMITSSVAIPTRTFYQIILILFGHFLVWDCQAVVCICPTLPNADRQLY